MQSKLFVQSLLAASMLILAPATHAAVCDVGDSASVTWKGSEYPAKVLKVNKEKTRCYIKYDGYGDNWNEWVGEDRIKVTGTSEESAAFNTGDPVQVKWKGSWYPASVIAVKGGKYKIHYDGYDNSWDEWVGNDRIKAQ